MLHLAFTERALLADEMGLGKTIQAIAACALLHRLGQARRALVVTPASLKTEWEEQIRRFTSLDYQLVFGGKSRRLKAFEKNSSTPFFTIVNYEQMVADALDVNARLAPDIVVLDEAQRIKNWNTKTAQAVKRLRSRYAFVLTGTPIENRIDELQSLMDFLQSGGSGAAVPVQPGFLRTRRPRTPCRLPQSRRPSPTHQALHAKTPQGRGGDRASRADRPQSLRPVERPAKAELRRSRAKGDATGKRHETPAR